MIPGINDIIRDLYLNWQPEVKTVSGEGYHGSSKGDIMEYHVYFDVYNLDWTTKKRAFKGYVFKKLFDNINWDDFNGG